MSLFLSLALLELRKKWEVLYGATAASALLGHKVARLGKRKSILWYFCLTVSRFCIFKELIFIEIEMLENNASTTTTYMR